MAKLHFGTQINEGRFEIDLFLGDENRGKVYVARDNESEGREVAVKIESVDDPNPRLLHEEEMLAVMNCAKGFLCLYWYGYDLGHRILVTQLVGPSLQDLFIKCDNSFSLKTVCMIADQILSRLKNLHSQLIIHRDIKPSCLLMGVGKNRPLLYLTDFSVAKEYVEDDGRHIPFGTSKPMPGNPLFASRNAHYGYELGRRDDIENALFVLMHFLNHELPWNRPDPENPPRDGGTINRAKLSTKVSIFVRGLPSVFEHAMNELEKWSFDGEPDYDLLRQMFRQQLDIQRVNFDFVFDWTLMDENPPSHLSSTPKPRVC